MGNRIEYPKYSKQLILDAINRDYGSIVDRTIKGVRRVLNDGNLDSYERFSLLIEFLNIMDKEQADTLLRGLKHIPAKYNVRQVLEMYKENLGLHLVAYHCTIEDLANFINRNRKYDLLSINSYSES